MNRESNKGIFPFFGKFQPDLYIIKPINKSTIEHNIDRNQDILKEFKEIDHEINFVNYIISGTIRFAIRGKYSKVENKQYFEIDPEGNHLFTCVWWKDNQFGIDSYEEKLFFKKTISNSGNSGYDYCITNI